MHVEGEPEFLGSQFDSFLTMPHCFLDSFDNLLSKKIYRYIDICICIYIHTHVCVCVCVCVVYCLYIYIFPPFLPHNTTMNGM